MRRSTYFWLLPLVALSFIWSNQGPGLEQRQRGCWQQLKSIGSAVETYARVSGDYPQDLPVWGGCPLGGEIRYTRGHGSRPYLLECSGPDRFRPYHQSAYSICF